MHLVRVLIRLAICALGLTQLPSASAADASCKECRPRPSVTPGASWTERICQKFAFADAAVECAEASIIGEDDRRVLKDHPDPEVRALSQKIPMINVCGTMSTAFLTRRKGDARDYLAVSAHAIFDHFSRFLDIKEKDGSERKCSPQEVEKAKIAFNLELLGTEKDKLGQKLETDVLQWPPINLSDGQPYGRTGEDILFFPLKRKLSEEKSDVTGRKRGYLRFVKPGHYDYKKFGNNSINVGFHADNKYTQQYSEYNFSFFVNSEIYSSRIDYFSNIDIDVQSSNSPIVIRNHGSFLVHSTVIGQQKNMIKVQDDSPHEYFSRIMTTERVVRKYNLETGPD